MAAECFTPTQVNEAFLAAPPLIAEQIQDLTIQHPSWTRDLWDMVPWPKGSGTEAQQLIIRGQMPQIERGFDKWRKLGNTANCNPCQPPDCSYNWTVMGGHGFDRRVVSLMDRDYRSPDYCVKEIQTSAQFREVFAQIVLNLYRQIDFVKEMNIGLNWLALIAKKLVVDSQGAKVNKTDIYSYPNIGSARLSMLNIGMLTSFYERLRRIPDSVPYDVVNGAPVYAAMASAEVLDALVLTDPNFRQDVRFSGLANDLVSKYNFMSTIRGMFLPAAILYPRRFVISSGEPLEVFPFVNDVPAEVGTYTYLNPDYENATHEEVILHGRNPFRVYYMETEQSLGDGTSFGPEFSFMNQWTWINPMTESDPARRVGYFFTNATIGLSQQYSEGIYAILVERPSTYNMAMFFPNPSAPPNAFTTNNIIPAQDCPCPLVTDISPNPVVANQFFVTFSSVVTGSRDSTVTFVLDNGNEITGTLNSISTDGYVAAVTFSAGLGIDHCSAIVGFSCGQAAECSATVLGQSECRESALGGVKLRLSNAIRAGAGDTINAYMGDCTTQTLAIVSLDASTLEYVVVYNGSSDATDGSGGTGAVKSYDMVCDRGGVTRVCVPPATDATCPPCSVTFAACENPIS